MAQVVKGVLGGVYIYIYRELRGGCTLEKPTF